MKKLIQLLLKYKLWLLAVLKPMGVWGVGCISVVDAAAIPVPMDLILAGYVWNDKRHFWAYVLLAAVGSAIGGLLPYLLGRAGGELFLLRRVNRVRFESMRDRFERQEFLAMMIPSMLPPPTPWKLFVFAAGVFEMRVANFMTAVLVGRVLRYMVTALLTIWYGPEIVHIASDLALRHRGALLTGVVLLIAGVVFYFVRKIRGGRAQVATSI